MSSINHDQSGDYSLHELSALAKVTPRTVRYYIVEGLLPPPLTTGRNATYGQDHLDRLHAIGVLKRMYLPLREMRSRLDVLSPEQMRDSAYLASLTQAVAMDRATHDEPTSPQLPADWERFSLGTDADLHIRTIKARAMGPQLYRMLHEIHLMLESDDKGDKA